jgi:HK97 family phage major capsid protein
MSKVSDNIRPLGARFLPLSGMSPQDEFFEYRGLGSRDITEFHREGYSLINLIKSQLQDSQMPANAEIERHVSHNISQNLRKVATKVENFDTPQGHFIPLDVFTRGSAIVTRDAVGDTGLNLVQTTIEPTIGQVLTPFSAVAKAGATIISGLRGNFAAPVWQAAQVAPSGVQETVNVTQGLSAATFILQQCQPSRINLDLGLGKQLLVQSQVPDLENLIKREILRQMASKLDQYSLLGQGTNSNTAPYTPVGLLNIANNTSTGTLVSRTCPPVTFGNPPTYANQVAMVEAVSQQSVEDDGSFGWVVSANVASTWANTPMITGFPRYLLDGGKAVNYPVYQTVNLNAGVGNGANDQAVFGRFSDLIFAIWAIDICVNPITSAASNIVILHINMLASCVPLHANAFVCSANSAAL